MNKRAIKWLYQELPELVANGVLNKETADKICQYYGEVKSAAKTSVTLIICGTLGALLIGLGIILLLAHNWEEFSRFTRTILSFAPLVIAQVLALWVLWKRSESGAFKEGAATFLSLMVGASIALISQTYNIPYSAGAFTLTWMLLIAPLIYLMQASLPAAIYLGGITVWSGSYWDNPVNAVLFWPLAAIVMPHFIWSLRQEIYTIRSTILSLVLMICVSFAAGFSLGKSWPGSWIIIFSSLYAIFYLVGCWKFNNRRFTANWQRPLRIIGSIGLFVLAFQLTFRFVWEYLVRDFYTTNRNIFSVSVLPDHIITLFIIAIAIVLLYDNIKRKNFTASLFGTLPALAIAAFFFREQKPPVLPLVIFNGYLFVLSVSRIMLGIRNNSLAAVNTGMLMLAILIMARFFDSDINFIIKGLVFIIIGIGFLAVNVSLVRHRGGAK